MTAPVPPEGLIEISYQVVAGRFAAVTVDNRRRLFGDGFLRGKAVEMVPAMVGRLFSVCRTAQGLGALQAVETALGRPAPSAHRRARTFLIQAETFLEHAGRICLDWTSMLGEAPAVAVFKEVRKALGGLERSFYPGDDWLVPGGGRLQIDAAAVQAGLAAAAAFLRQTALGEPSGNERDWAVWAGRGDSLGQRLAARLLADDLAGFARSDAVPLPAFPEGERPPAGWRATAGELPFPLGGDRRFFLTGALARQWRQPSIAALRSSYGNGLLPHVAARLVEMAGLLREMQGFEGASRDDDRSPTAAAGEAMAVIEAARGRLVHAIALDGGRVGDYRIWAPTEWNFHPQGALVRGLMGSPAGEDAEGRVRHLTVALDPCVAYRIRAS